MNENNDNSNNPAEVIPALDDYQKNFMPKVHMIGRVTMAIAFFLAFLPVLYFYFAAGYKESPVSYLNVAIAITSIGIGMWLTEPIAYWPVLGSAGTYMGYLSGNVSGMRFPVALSVQSAMKADINTLRGQVVTIIGIVASIFTNLVILIIIVLMGGWLLGVLPNSVKAAFAYVMPCLLGSMFMMRFSSAKGGLPAGIKEDFPYLATAIIVKLLISNVFTMLAHYGTALSVGVTILVAYIMYRARISKAA